jgi:hypothetical protein
VISRLFNLFQKHFRQGLELLKKLIFILSEKSMRPASLNIDPHGDSFLVLAAASSGVEKVRRRNMYLPPETLVEILPDSPNFAKACRPVPYIEDEIKDLLRR